MTEAVNVSNCVFYYVLLLFPEVHKGKVQSFFKLQIVSIVGFKVKFNRRSELKAPRRRSLSILWNHCQKVGSGGVSPLITDTGVDEQTGWHG